MSFFSYFMFLEKKNANMLQSLDVRGTYLPNGRSACQLGVGERRLALVELRTLAAKDLPEAKSLIGSSRNHGVAVRAHGHVEHTGLVAGEVRNLDHRGVLPQRELVLGEAVRRENLLLVLAPHERAHLRVGVDLLQESAGGAVPEADLPVGSAAARCEEVGLVGAPSEGLDRSSVVQDLVTRGSLGGVPDVEDVVVAAAGELLAVDGPLEAADLLGVRVLEARCHVLGDANIVVDDGAVAAAAAENVRVPCESANCTPSK